MIANLNKLLHTKAAELPKAILIHANGDFLPLAAIAINNFKEELGHEFVKHKFTADRYFDINNLADIIAGGDLFATKNYIELNYATKPTQEQQQQLYSVIESLDLNTILVITTDKLTATDLKSVWVQSFNKLGLVVNIDNSDIKDYIYWQAKQNSVDITADAVNLLIEQNSGNIIQLVQELNLLLLSITTGIIDVQQIKKIDNAQYTVYQLSNAYLNGNLATSLKILDNLYQKTEDAILINWILAEDTRKLIQLIDKVRHGTPIRSALSEIRVWGEAYPLTLKRLGYSSLLGIFNLIAELDLNIKGINQADTYQLIKQIIVQFTTPVSK
jgi:DNA polymerase-3 subunit delta